MFKKTMNSFIELNGIEIMLVNGQKILTSPNLIKSIIITSEQRSEF